LLPEAGGEPIEEHLETKALTETELPFYKFYDSEYLAAKKILEAAKAYDVANSAHLKRFELGKARKSMLESFA